MKNVLKRCISLLTLFNDESNQISTEYIRDNISSYRHLSDSAFKRSFERDKVLLREMGYSLDYVNDKWSIDEGYNLSGTSIINSIKKNQNIEFNQFLNTYHIIKKYIDSNSENTNNMNNVSKLNDAIKEKKDSFEGGYLIETEQVSNDLERIWGKAIELGLTTNAAVSRMKKNILRGKFASEHYLKLWS